jgi:hypothetical protein
LLANPVTHSMQRCLAKCIRQQAGSYTFGLMPRQANRAGVEAGRTAVCDSLRDKRRAQGTNDLSQRFGLAINADVQAVDFPARRVMLAQGIEC